MKQLPFHIMLMLVLISKTIEEPIFLNLSPADALWPLAVFVFAWYFLRRPNFRKQIKDNKVWLVVIVLFLWGLGVSALSFKFNTPSDMSLQAFLRSLIVNNLKSLLIAGYYTLGLWGAGCVRHKDFQTVAWGCMMLFSMVGLKAFFTGTPEWGMSGQRIISMVNDPNVAAWVCLLGMLFVWSLVLGTTLRVKWQQLLLKGLTLLSVPVFIFTLLLTGSRTGMVGFGLLAFVLFLSLMRTGSSAVLLISTVLLLGTGLIHLDHDVLEGKTYAQISSRVFNGTESASDFREILRKAAFEMGKDHPFIGVGTGQFPNFSTTYYEAIGEDVATEHFLTTIAPKVPHNTYATFFAERGMIGGGLFLLLIGLGLKSARSGPEYGFMGLVILYSMFFNIENIRFVWFLWGGMTLLRPDVNLNREEALVEFKSWPQKLFLAAALISSVLFFVNAIGHLYRTDVELSGQTVEVIVADGGLDITLQMTGSRKDPLFIRFDGPEVRDVIVRNAYNFYHDHYDLIPGMYTLTLDSGSKRRKLDHMRIQSGDVDEFLSGDLMSDGQLKIWTMDDTYVKLFLMDTVRKNVIYEPVEYEDVWTKYIHQSTGINFGNQISLMASTLTPLDEAGKYEMVWTFKKRGSIQHSYTHWVVAYDLRDSRQNHAKNIAQNITFDPPLTDLEIGDTFTATWTIDTENRPYMIQYGFYYKDPDTGAVTRPYPYWVRQGYIQ